MNIIKSRQAKWLYTIILLICLGLLIFLGCQNEPRKSLAIAPSPRESSVSVLPARSLSFQKNLCSSVNRQNLFPQKVAFELLGRGETGCDGIKPASTLWQLFKVADWWESRHRREVRYAIQSVEVKPDYIRQEIFFSDQVVGGFRVFLFIPKNADWPRPAVLMTHGHNSGPLAMWEQGGTQLIKRGFWVVSQQVLEFELNQEEEYRKNLLGTIPYVLNLIPFNRCAYGVLTYRTGLLIDFLASRAGVDKNRIAMWGHSGGSTLAETMLAMDDRVKAAVTDFHVNLPEPAEMVPPSPAEEVVPQQFCWGGGSLVEKLGAGKPKSFYQYGYPDDKAAKAADFLLTSMRSSAECGDGVCGPGENNVRCGSDCRSSGKPITFLEKDVEISLGQINLFTVLDHVSDDFWWRRTGGASSAESLADLVSLTRWRSLLDCLPQPARERKRTSATQVLYQRIYYLGRGGRLDVDIHQPRGAPNEKQPLLLWLSNQSLPSCNSQIDEQELKQELIKQGFLIIEPHFPFSEPSFDSYDETIYLLPYGLYMPGLYLWEAETILQAVAREFGRAEGPIFVYGHDGLALTALYLGLMYPEIKAIATDLLWPVWDPDGKPNAECFHPAMYFPGQAHLGTKRQALARFRPDRLLIFDRATSQVQQIVDFYQKSLTGD